MKTFPLDKIFTSAQINQAKKIFTSHKDVHKRILAEVIEPNMADINSLPDWKMMLATWRIPWNTL